jgi:hypothetical protein
MRPERPPPAPPPLSPLPRLPYFSNLSHHRQKLQFQLPDHSVGILPIDAVVLKLASRSEFPALAGVGKPAGP